jgi:hypothetical protein
LDASLDEPHCGDAEQRGEHDDYGATSETRDVARAPGGTSCRGID